MSAVTKLTAEQIENLAKEIREFLLEHGLWQDVDIYFNGKKYTSYDPENGEYYYNDREHLIEVVDQPERHFEYVNPEHILSMSFEGPVCEMLYYGILPSVRGLHGSVRYQNAGRRTGLGDSQGGAGKHFNSVYRRRREF